jgi:hypothetical protein
MRRTVVGVFMRRARADAALQRLAIKGFDAECPDGLKTACPSPIDRAVHWRSAAEALRRVTECLLSIAKAAMPDLSRSCVSHEGEGHVKAHGSSALEAQTVREIPWAAGARRHGSSATAWTNWNW